MALLSAEKTGGLATQVGTYDPMSFKNAPAGSYEADLYRKQVPASTSASVINSKPAEADLQNIQAQHQQIAQGMQAQGQRVNEFQMAQDATNERNRQANAQQQTDASKIQTERDKNGLGPLSDATEEYDYLKKQRQEMADEYKAQAEEVRSTIMNITNGAVPLSSAESAQVTGLQNQFQQLIQQQQLVNQGAQGVANVRGYQKGSAEYDPKFQVNTIGSIITAGNNKVADLNIKMAAAVAEMTEGFKTNKIKNVKEAFELYQDSYTARQESIQETIKEAQEQIKRYQDYAEEERKENAKIEAKQKEDIYKIMQDAAKGGAPKEVVNAISGATSMEDAVARAGDYLNTSSGIVGEYLFYKRNAQNAGITPKTFEEYQDADANRKQLASQIVDGSNMNPKEQAIFNSLVDKANRSPLIMAKDRTGVLQSTINNLKKNPANGAQQLGIVYGYVQALDTYQSAVREGELALVNSIDSKVGQLQNYVEKIQNGQVVRPEVALQIADAAQLLVDSISSQAERKLKDFQAQAKINGSNVDKAFGDYLNIVSENSSGNTMDKQMTTKETLDNFYTQNEGNPELLDLLDEFEANGVSEDQMVKWLQKNGHLSFNDAADETDPELGIVGGFDIESYATDPQHEARVATIYQNTKGVYDAAQADEYIRAVAPNSPVTGKDVMDAALKYDVSPGMILAIMQQDSTFGTAGKAVRTKNPGNVGNDDTGKLVDMGTWRNGVMAVAKNLSKRKVNNNIG